MTMTVALGEFACSFSAEAKTLHLVLDALLRESVAETRNWRSATVLLDSQSCPAALASSPGASKDALVTQVWERIFAIVGAGVTITLAFIFGHVGFAPHDIVHLVA